ncbi:MAG: hypothetical protein V8Q79_07420 [Christensenellales bacterium]
MEKMEKESLTAQNSPENPAENTPEKPELNERVGIAEAILFVTGNAIEKHEMCSAMNLTEQELDETLDELESGYDFDRADAASALRSACAAGDAPGLCEIR